MSGVMPGKAGTSRDPISPPANALPVGGLEAIAGAQAKQQSIAGGLGQDRADIGEDTGLLIQPVIDAAGNVVGPLGRIMKLTAEAGEDVGRQTPFLDWITKDDAGVDVIRPVKLVNARVQAHPEVRVEEVITSHADSEVAVSKTPVVGNGVRAEHIQRGFSRPEFTSRRLRFEKVCQGSGRQV